MPVNRCPFLFLLLPFASCADWVAPAFSVALPCEASSDCEAGLICHRGYCLTRCGDGVLQEGEGCDDGNANPNDGCTNSCQPARCGDGVVQLGVEACDDGNEEAKDACSTSCRLSFCGDGIIRTDLPVEHPEFERCDDGDTRDDNICTSLCRPAVCGDGAVFAGEENCDDGNEQNQDACRNDCEPAVCGDGVLRLDLGPEHEGFEACDDGNEDRLDSCTNDCSLARCGDGLLRTDLARGEEGFEACDDGNEVDGDDCTNSCRVAGCGDGVVLAGVTEDDPNYEACDDGNDDNEDACTNNCRLAFCGDGFTRQDLAVGEAGYEQCDDRNEDDLDGCNNACEGTSCGDGVVNRLEHCDDGNRVDGDGCSAQCGLGIVSLHTATARSCVLLERGWVYCWGTNYQGGAERVEGLEQVSQLRTSSYLTAALEGERVYQWGRLMPNQDPVRSPAEIEGARGATWLAIHNRESCVALSSGRVKCWGPRWGVSPIEIIGLSQMVQLDVGGDYGCGLDESRRVWCWGSNELGQLGQGDRAPRDEPVEVLGLGEVRSVFTAYGLSCALNEADELWCWGDPKSMPVAPNQAADSPRHAQALGPVDRLQKVTSSSFRVLDAQGRSAVWARDARRDQDVEINPQQVGSRLSSVGSSFHCWLDEEEQMRCLWNTASNRSYGGQLGNGVDPLITRPRQLLHTPLARHFSGTSAHMCLVDRDGSAWCRGDNRYGQLGDVNQAGTSFRNPWSPSHDFDDLVTISTSGNHVCSLSAGGQAHCWGRGLEGQLGGGLAENSPSPILISGTPVHKIEAKLNFSCAIHGEDRRMSCWGDNQGQRLGGGMDVPQYDVPIRVGSLAGLKDFALGDGASCAIDAQDQLQCWGRSDHLFWELDEAVPGEPLLLSLPRALPQAGSLAKLRLVGNRACAAGLDERLSCWGNWGQGRPSGTGNVDYNPAPTPDGAQDLGIGSKHGCVLSGDGRVNCWGRNTAGQIGNGRIHNSTYPMTLLELEGIEQLEVNGYNSCARDEQGRMFCWGPNGRPLKYLEVFEDGYDWELVRGLPR